MTIGMIEFEKNLKPLVQSPLKNRLGEAYFKLTPQAPGIYWFQDKSGKCIYVGLTKNLYRHLKTLAQADAIESDSLTYEVLSKASGIFWKQVATEEETFSLYRLSVLQQQPTYNLMFEQKKSRRYFLGTSLHEDCVQLCLIKKESPENYQRFYGPFSSFQKLKLYFKALSRQAWLLTHHNELQWPIPAYLLSRRDLLNVSISLTSQTQLQNSATQEALVNFLMGKNNAFCEMAHQENLFHIEGTPNAFLEQVILEDYQLLREMFRTNNIHYLRSKIQKVPIEFATIDWPSPLFG